VLLVKAGLHAGFLVLLLFIAGCRNQTSSVSSTTLSSASNSTGAVTKPTDPWLGRWDGPEGTYLELSKDGDKYVVVIRDLDGPRTFEGFGDGHRIRFTRDGKTEFISTGDGEAAGMKWLADKKNCLLTKKGEGWCRN
jgi:hypothetical protein